MTRASNANALRRRSIVRAAGGLAATIAVAGWSMDPTVHAPDEPAPAPPAVAEPDTSKAAAAYVAAVAPLNEAFRAFADAPTPASLLDAFRDVAVRLAELRAAYAPAAAELDAVSAAVGEVVADLEGVLAWRDAFDEDIGALTAVSNELRFALGLPPANG